MRLDNYYVVKLDIDDCGEEYSTLDFIKANVFDKQSILDKDYEYYSIIHCWENYDGTFEEEEIFLYQNNEVEIDEENLMAEDLKNSKVETQNQNERLSTLLYNAITLLETNNGYGVEELITELGMTSEEYDKIIYGD